MKTGMVPGKRSIDLLRRMALVAFGHDGTVFRIVRPGAIRAIANRLDTGEQAAASPVTATVYCGYGIGP